MSSSPTCNPSHTQQHISHSITQNHHPMITRSKHGIFKLKVLLSNYATSSPLTEPRSLSEALSIKEWHAAMDLVFQALCANNTWFLVLPLPNCQLVGCKWVFKVKQNFDGSVNKYKLKLV